jgi:fibronectin-binding autotransporter adhesin
MQRFILMAMIGFSCGPLFAVDAVWQGNVSSEWNTSDLNWTRGGSPNQVYVDGDAVIFDDMVSSFTVIGTVTYAPASVLVSNATTYTISAPIGGSGVLTKMNAGVLELRGTNSYTGGTVIHAGTVDIAADSNLGQTNSPVAFVGSSTLRNKAGTIDLGARPISVASNAIATFYVDRGDRTYVYGDVSGAGGVAIQVSGGASPKVFLHGLNNTFTGPVEVRNGSDNPSIYFNSLADSSSPITLFANAAHFVYDTGAMVPLTLENRPIVINGGGTIDNLSSYPLTINGEVSVLGTGGPTLSLTGGSGGSIAADIDEGAATLNVALSGPWTLSGSNRWSGATTINASATLGLHGLQAVPTGSKFIMNRNATLRILTDSAGRSVLGNELEFRRVDTSTGVIQNYNVYVANDGGGTTNSTIVFGTVDFTQGDMRPTRQLNATGADGYLVEVGNVELATEIQGSATGGGQRLCGVTAPLKVTGTVKHLNGSSGTRVSTANLLYLGGVGIGNEISGTIADADDYVDGSNTNAAPLNIYKGDSGEWILSGANSYSGTTTIVSGDLYVSGSIDGGGAVTVSGGSLGGTGYVSGAVTLSGTGGINVQDGAVGTLALGSGLAINGPSSGNELLFDLGSGTNGTDQITVAGDVTMVTPGAGLVTLLQLGGSRIDPGTYDLIVATGAMPAATNFTLATTAAFGNTFALQRDGTARKLQVVVTGAPPAPPTAFWKGGIDDNWSTPGNWTSDEAGTSPLSVAPGYETDVKLYAAGASRLTTGTLDADFDVDSLSYVAAATNNTTISSASQKLILEATSGTGVMVASPDTNTPLHTIATDIAIASSQEWMVQTGASLTVSGVIDDLGGGKTLTKAGVGSLHLSGLNTYVGPTVVGEGALEIWHYSLGNVTVPNALGMSPADPANLVLEPGTTLRFIVTGDTSKSTDRGFTINGSAPGDSATLECMKEGTSGWRGVQLTSTQCPGYGVPDQARTLILAGTQYSAGGQVNHNTKLYASIADNGTGAVSLEKKDSGSWALLGNNTYTGGTTINGGSLRMSMANTLPAVGAVTLADVAGAQLDLSDEGQGGRNQTMGSLAGGGSNGGNVKLGSATLTVGDASSTTFAGNISGTGNLVKQGEGMLTLSASNTYSGTTTVNAGTLKLGADFALGSGDVMLGGGTLDLGASLNSAGALHVDVDSTIVLGNGQISFTNSAAVVWPGGLTLVGTLRNGTLRIGTSDSALTPEQLALINHEGTSVTISPDGYLQSQRGLLLLVR